MNPFKIIKYQLYLLQLENYELGRYWKLLLKKGLWGSRQPLRKNLEWTNKVKALVMAAAGLHVLIAAIIGWWSNRIAGPLWAVIFFALAVVVFSYLNFIFFSLAWLLLWPLDFILKSIVISRAKKKIQDLPNLKIVGIAGSYGKTTMKEVLVQVLGIRYKVLGTPESVNTPVGIARWILKNLDQTVDVAVVEMGEHYQGDVKEICDIAKPDIAAVTGINEAHLERMKILANIAATIFEIVDAAKPGATILLNGEDKHVVENYKKYVWKDHRVAWYKAASVKDKAFNPESLSWKCQLEDLGELNINLLGEYVLANVDAAVIIGRSLGLNREEIKLGLSRIKPIEHRLQPIKSAGGILIIDDSYNGNPDGVKEAIKVLARFNNKRRIFITPGLVEMGQSAKEVHRQIGRELVGVADIVILIKDSVTPFIEQGINDVIASGAKQSNQGIDRHGPTGFAMTGALQVIWFDTAVQAHEGLKNIIKPGDVVLFQNDWGDQYL